MPDLWGLAAIATKFFLYLGVLASGGLILCRLVLADQMSALDRAARIWAIGFATLAVAMAALGFAVRGAVLMDDVSGMVDPSILALLWQTPPGEALLFRLLGLGTLVLGAAIGGRWLWVAAVGGAVAIWSFCEIGHVASQDRLWFQSVLFAHLIAAAFWIGIFLPLSRLSRSADTLGDAAALGHRFGQIAAVAVPLLVVAGAIMTWRLVGSVSALFGTGYGLWLLAKLAAVALLLALAALNKVRLVPALQRGDPGVGTQLSKSISLEWLCVGVILLATAIFTSVLTVPT
ncbi:copper resistance D family protein [Thalassovita mediterranea]|uniref:Putative copper export protein n=1 Tax=Thalassovita mediterranea TaxID=340021 RepID=A0A0P1H576_9RHOB|nr:CopD family protein [Thalassovita mediterranea]CUH85993.1 Putative copper export protein [Thalassovita mediterranea]SIS34689.1 putative copper resistance protein D [Thalassovita mediterranea]